MQQEKDTMVGSMAASFATVQGHPCNLRGGHQVA